MAGITAKFEGETRGGGGSERERKKSEENGDGGGQMVRDERERGCERETEIWREVEE